MAGLLSRQSLRIAAGAAVRELRMLDHIKDSYGDPFAGAQIDTEALALRLERGDIDGIAEALPQLMTQVLAPQEPPNGP